MPLAPTGRVFAPLSVPLERRLQTLAVLWWLSLPFTIALVLAQLLPVLPLVFPLIIAYCLWALLDRAPYEGGRCWHAAKHWRFPFAYFTAYFPVTVVREEELDPRDSYLFGYHPHGILGLGVWGTFISAVASGFTTLFPGIDVRIATLEQNFRLPVWRDALMALGFCGVSKQTCKAIFEQRQKLRMLGKRCRNCGNVVRRVGRHLEVEVQEEKDFDEELSVATDEAIRVLSASKRGDANASELRGRRGQRQDVDERHDDAATTSTCLCTSPLSLVVVVGGATEALDAHPSTYDLTLYRRKGVFRLAYQHGIALVPVLSFGENDLYQQLQNPHGSLLRKVQLKLLKVFGFSMPLFWGRGVFNYLFGLLPRRKPIYTVIGRPLRPEVMVMTPSDEQIEELRDRYIQELERIYEKYKDKFAPDRKRELSIVK